MILFLFYNSKDFNEYETNDCSVQIGDNSQVQVKGYDNIKVNALVDDEWEPRTIEHVFYVSG